MQQTDSVSMQMAGGVARLTLAHAGRHNILTTAMLAQLDDGLRRIESSAEVRVVFVEGAGERSFCAGADIRQWGVLTPQQMGAGWIREGNRVFERLARLDAVVVCMMGGDALGGGLELALACDLRLAADGARLGFPEVGIGAIPGWLGCARLQELVGAGRARQMILTGNPIDARTALDWGLLNEVAPRAELAQRAEALAATLLARSPVALGAAKRVLNAGLDAPRHSALHELAASVCMASADGAEGLAAFREKRPPRFPGR